MEELIGVVMIIVVVCLLIWGFSDQGRDGEDAGCFLVVAAAGVFILVIIGGLFAT